MLYRVEVLARAEAESHHIFNFINAAESAAAAK